MEEIIINLLYFSIDFFAVFWYNKNMNNIQQNLLTYLGFCFKKPRRRFAYSLCLADLKKVGVKTKIATLYKELSYAKTKGFVRTKKFYRREIPVLTLSGHLAVKTRLPFKKFDVWDKKWRIVSISAPTKERANRLKLINLLHRLGFGKLGRNLFISPHPLKTAVTRMATDLGLQKYVACGELDKLRDEKQEIAAAWDLENVDKSYRKFLKNAQKAPRDQLWPLRAKILERGFAINYARDPHLPMEFLPANWAGAKAYARFKEIANSY